MRGGGVGLIRIDCGGGDGGDGVGSGCGGGRGEGGFVYLRDKRVMNVNAFNLVGGLRPGRNGLLKKVNVTLAPAIADPWCFMELEEGGYQSDGEYVAVFVCQRLTLFVRGEEDVFNRC